jgi:hypothetical protein
MALYHLGLLLNSTAERSDNLEDNLIRYTLEFLVNWRSGMSDNLEDDLLRGAPQCLRHLSDALKCGDGQPESARQALKPPLVEKRLGEKLAVMCSLLCADGHEWTWDVDVGESRLEGLFLVLGSSRSKAVQQPFYMFELPGFQLVFQKDQHQKFKDADFFARMDMIYDLLFSDTTVVADVVVSAQQSAALSHEDEESEKMVTHSLRLEMVFTQTGGLSRHGHPMMTRSSWVLSDWNGVLSRGYHRGSKRDVWGP